MAKLDGAELVTKTPILPKCEKYAKALQKRTGKPSRKIDLESIGSPHNNLLVDFLKCQCKSKSKICSLKEKVYSKCHSGIMGVGSYEGRKHCGTELESLVSCVMNNSQGSN